MPKPFYRHFSVISFYTAILLAACSNADTNSSTQSIGDIFMQVKITGEEEKENATCLVQFFDSDTSERSVLLAAPAAVLLDGEPLKADSTRFTGTYYEIQKPIQNFGGSHTITFKNAAGRVYTEVFDFTPFTLATEVGERVKKGTLNLQIAGLKEKDSLNILVVDTSFSTIDIDRLQVTENGSLQLTKTDLLKLAAGPITLYLVKDEERRVKNGKGKIVVSYSLKREFELVD